MSTTLLPPSDYVVRPRGQAARRYETLAQAAAEIARLLPAPASVSVITGRRRRSLTDRELRELARHVRIQRLYRDNPPKSQRS